ncbi:MAG: hypothetical protein HYX37_05465 [Rhizobiales bacterium]|nr:hypothetical protein [Hyphomicrobiales bacterium]
MNNIDDLEIYISRSGRKWLAATATSPYFCFEADSERALYAKVRKALVFLKKAAAHITAGEHDRASEPFHTQRKFFARDLEAA